MDFHNKCGGLARKAYNLLLKTDGLLNDLEGMVQGMGINILTQVQWMAPDELNTSSKEPFIDEQQWHKFLSVFPWSDKNQNAYVIWPPTETIADLIFAAVSQNYKQHE